MRILISNDDGVDSPGILILAKAMEKVGEVTVVAPERERSTAGHSLTLHKPLRVTQVEKNIYSTSGTPADCVYIGGREIMSSPPDIVLSGINKGANLGTDVHYSGTVAAARQGAMENIKSYAFSLVYFKGSDAPLQWEMAAEVACSIVMKTHQMKFPPHTLLNVNIPSVSRDKIKGIHVARQGFRYYSNEVLKRQDPRGKEYYWIGGTYESFEPMAESDCHAVHEGFVSLTPLTVDCTHKEFYTTLKQVEGELR